MIEFFKELWDYLRYRRLLLLYYGLTLAILLAVRLLGGQDGALTLYAAGLMSFVLLGMICFDMPRFRARRAPLHRLARCPGVEEAPLSVAGNALEADYRALVESLYRLLADTREQGERAHEANLQYYTLWLHQIKTPISAMHLLLKAGEEGGGVRESELLEQELFKIERYVELALQYVKMEDMASDLLIQPCRLDVLVHESVKKYAILFIYRHLSVEIGPLERQVLSDAKWLPFLLEQLLSNALKYTSSGGIRIYWEEERGALVLEDSGIGIRPEDLPRVFEKGYTGYNGRLDQKASGLGLNMVKRVAETLRIRVQLESRPGRGTKAYLCFPQEDGSLRE